MVWSGSLRRQNCSLKELENHYIQPAKQNAPWQLLNSGDRESSNTSKRSATRVSVVKSQGIVKKEITHFFQKFK